MLSTSITNATSVQQPVKINLLPVEEFLTEVIHPKELSETLDELMFDYTRTAIESGQSQGQAEDCLPSSEMHPETVEFIHWLRELRNLFRRCEAR